MSENAHPDVDSQRDKLFVCPNCGSPHFSSYPAGFDKARIYRCGGNEWRNILSCSWEGDLEPNLVTMTARQKNLLQNQMGKAEFFKRFNKSNNLSNDIDSFPSFDTSSATQLGCIDGREIV